MARKDSRGYALKKGESQRKDGRYVFRYTTIRGEQKAVYAKELSELRKKEVKIRRAIEDGLDPDRAERITLNELFDEYISQKYDLKQSTLTNYKYMYNHYVRVDFGKRRISKIKYTDVKKFYYSLIMEKGFKPNSMEIVNTLLHPTFTMAVRDGLLRLNPTEGVMTEIKKSHSWEKKKRHALTIPEQKAFTNYIANSEEYRGWYPLFTVMLGTGCRIGEVLGLRWQDIDFKNRTISINHNLVYRVQEDGSCTNHVNSPKTSAGIRIIPMLDDVFDAFLEEYQYHMLINQVKEFSPDVAIFMLNCTHRDDVDSDVNFLKKLSESYAQAYNMRLPIVAVVNKCDEMAPSRLKNPNEYTESKTKKIAEQVKHYKEIIVKNNLKIDDIIAVSSLIDWMTADGTEIDADSIESLPVSDIENLQIAFDGRYHIEELFNILEKAILDFSARMGLRMALKLQEVVRRIANQLNKSFSAMSATVALSPIPISDIYILLLLQGILVCLIASLSGRDISLDTAKEFVLSMGGIAGAGYGFRLLAQQASKILNVFWAGSGSAVSASIAALGTSAIGKAAIAYYIDDKTIEEAKSTFEASRKED